LTGEIPCERNTEDEKRAIKEGRIPAKRVGFRKIGKAARQLKSKVRSGVEHVFAVQKDKMDLFIRTVGSIPTKTTAFSGLLGT
jgi:hypothetical protein